LAIVRDSAGKIVLFVIFMLIVDKRALPWMLSVVVRTHSRELFTLSVFVVAVGVAFSAAHLFDISFALGVFFAVMMIKESDFPNEVTQKLYHFMMR
jgi:monovalent cation:H+ antiporter-2, CPA2 family